MRFAQDDAVKSSCEVACLKNAETRLEGFAKITLYPGTMKKPVE